MDAAGLAKGLAALKPAKSQVVLTVLALGGLLLVWQGGALLADEKAGGWMVGPGCLLLGAVFWGWLKSQPDVDLDKATQTKLGLADGSHLTTDMRVLRDKGATENLATLLGALIERQPLPEPAGLIDAQGQIISDSGDAAKAQALAINKEVEAWKLQVAGRLPGVLGGSTVMQTHEPIAEGQAIPEPPQTTEPSVIVGPA